MHDQLGRSHTSVGIQNAVQTKRSLTESELDAQRGVAQGIESAINRLSQLKQRIFGAEPESVGNGQASTPVNSGFLPELIDIRERSESALKYLHTLLDNIEGRFNA